MRTNIVLTSEGRSVIVITDDSGESSMVTDTHVNYEAILRALAAKEDHTHLLDGTPPEPTPIITALANLSAHVTIVDDVLHFDGDPRFDVLADTIRRYHEEGRDNRNFIRFMERLSLNPSESSRDALFTWAQAKDLTIDPDGFIIAYKGVTADMLSVHSGTAIVNGVEVKGQIPNLIGQVIEMPRDQVNPDTSVGCSTGLHVGSWDYASSFGAVLLEVRLDPADVVSVPRDCDFQKLRCCRYTVIDIHDRNDGDDLSDYEPDPTVDDDEAWDGFMSAAPEGWVARLRASLRLNRKNKGGES